MRDEKRRERARSLPDARTRRLDPRVAARSVPLGGFGDTTSSSPLSALDARPAPLNRTTSFGRRERVIARIREQIDARDRRSMSREHVRAIESDGSAAPGPERRWTHT